MTFHELSQLYYLEREIKSDWERLASLTERVCSPSAPSLTGMPGGGKGSVRQRIPEVLGEIEKVENQIRKNILLREREKVKLEQYISGIPDSLTRQIFTLRFIECRSWTQIALRVGGGNTEEGVRKRVQRYLDKTEV